VVHPGSDVAIGNFKGVEGLGSLGDQVDAMQPDDDALAGERDGAGGSSR
jgi:hypothetical protein